MIHVERSRVEEPEFLSGERCRSLRLEAQEHFKSATSDSRRFQFGLRQLRRGVDGALDELFHGKCAYCEQVLTLRGLRAAGPYEGTGPRQIASDARTAFAAYQEMRAGSPPADRVALRNFEHFRPKRGAVQAEIAGESSPSHYWWLFYEWHNLYLACQACNTNKRNRFPVAGERAPLETPWARIDREEHRLLIDPCADEPSQYLVFCEDGTVRPGPDETLRRGAAAARPAVTIEVLGLNRYELVEARKLGAARFEALLHGARDAGGWAERIRRLLADEAPFAALHRQLAARFILATDDPDPDFADWLEQTYPRVLAAERERAAGTAAPAEPLESGPRRSAGPEPTRGADDVLDPTLLSFSVEEAPELRTPAAAVLPAAGHATSATVRRLTVTNFKAIRKLEDVLMPEIPSEPVTELAGDEAPQTQLGWLSFLGENGVGKSSILQAITLALAGPRIADDESLKPPSRFIRRRGAADRDGEEITAAVELELSNLARPLRLEITHAGGFEFPQWQDPGVFVRAYGATRFPARSIPRSGAAQAAPDAPGAVRYGNLFDPFTPLVDVKQWLRSLAGDPTARGAARQALEDLLGLGPEPGADEPAQLRLDVSEDGDLFVDDEPLENLSSGYQTLIAVAADIMAGLPQTLSDMQDAGGIVLLDEIGAHLHPGWKMVIVPRLRTAFPGMQFITTTHEPLCLRGHTQGEVGVVTRKQVRRPHPEDPARTVEVFDVELATDLPSPKNLRVDQLLTSKHFGLDSTIDPELDASFRRYYHLLARHDDELEEDQIAEREALREQLRGQGILGYTRRDQLIYDAIDQYIAEERRIEDEARAEAQDDEGREQRRRRVMRDVIDLWRFAKRDETEGGAAS